MSRRLAIVAVATEAADAGVDLLRFARSARASAHVYVDRKGDETPGLARINLAALPDTIPLHNITAGLFPDDPDAQTRYRAAGLRALALAHLREVADPDRIMLVEPGIPTELIEALLDEMDQPDLAYRAIRSSEFGSAAMLFDCRDSRVSLGLSSLPLLYLSGAAAAFPATDLAFTMAAALAAAETVPARLRGAIEHWPHPADRP